MKKIRIAINGFGRIGRLAARVIMDRKNFELVAVNDPFLDAEYAAYMFKYDSVHGTYKNEVKSMEGKLVINNNLIPFFSEKEPSALDWKSLKVDIVLECAGKFTHYDDCMKHINAGAAKVIVSAPGKAMPTFIMGVNQHEYQPQMKIVSNGSCTTNCIVPLAKVLHDNFIIEEGLMTTVHAVTATQLTVDGSSKKDWRGGRAAYSNIIPSSTGAAKAVGEIIPSLKNKITGLSLRVPTNNVSVIDLTVRLKKEITMENVVAAFKKAEETDMKGIIGVTDEALVSTDFVGDDRTCILDTNASIILNPHFAKFIAWYDNEWAYSVKLVDLAEYISK